MSNQKIWTSIDEIFAALNSAECNYVVMRNFECFEQGHVFVNGHDDIDLLCDDIKKIKKILDVRKRFLFPMINSYYILFNDLIVHVDIRFVGDGYYDLNWQKDMLKNKILYHNKIYVPDYENYFYSLIYHAMFAYVNRDIQDTDFATDILAYIATDEEELKVLKDNASYIEGDSIHIELETRGKALDERIAMDYDIFTTKDIGDIGESLIHGHECMRIKLGGREDLIHLIKRIPTQFAVGYDISSVELDERKRYIEVKTTISSKPLHLTLKKSENLRSC